MQLKSKKRRLVEEIDKIKKLITLGHCQSIDTDGYLETLDQLKRAVSSLDPNRESFNDLFSIMTKRRESLIHSQ